MPAERGPSGTGREYPPELVHGELCATRFSLKAVCDCGKEPEPARGPSGTGHDTAAKGEIVDFEALCASCGHAAKLHHPMTPLRTCAAMVYTDAPIGGGSCYPCRCRGFVPPDPPVAVPGPASVSPAERVHVPEGAAHPSAPGEGLPADPVVSPADTIRRARTSAKAMPWPASQRVEELADLAAALMAVGERDKAEIARLADRAVCSGCGQDVDEGGVCHTPECHTGEMIPSSDLPGALLHLCEENAEERAEWRSDWEELRAEAKALEVAGEPDRQQIARLTEALREWHDWNCGCDRPGNPAACVCEPIESAAVLAGEEDARP